MCRTFRTFRTVRYGDLVTPSSRPRDPTRGQGTGGQEGTPMFRALFTRRRAEDRRVQDFLDAIRRSA